MNHNYSELDAELQSCLTAFTNAQDRPSAADFAWQIKDRICYAGVEVDPIGFLVIQRLWKIAKDHRFAWRHYAIQMISSVGAVHSVMAVAPSDEEAVALAKESILSGIGGAWEFLASADREIRGSAIELLGYAAPDPRNLIARFTEELSQESDMVLQADLAEAIVHSHLRTPWDLPLALLDDFLANRNPAIRWRVSRALMWWCAGPRAESLQEIVNVAYRQTSAAGLFRDEFA